MAIISTNGGFRDRHSYQGIIGWIWAWFGGMLLFLIMFRHGLFAAMLVHSLYNLCIWALTWLIARRYMTPEEAQGHVLAKLETQQAWLAKAGYFPPATVIDQAPPPPNSVNPLSTQSTPALHNRRLGAASQRRRLRRDHNR